MTSRLWHRRLNKASAVSLSSKKLLRHAREQPIWQLRQHVDNWEEDISVRIQPGWAVEVRTLVGKVTEG